MSANKYWSSTTLPNQTTKAWYLDTQFGITTYDFKTLKHNLICVSGNLTTTGVSEIKISGTIIYPNPFASTISLKNKDGDEIFELTNCVGQIIYSGTNIEQQNFFFLTNGIYFLKVFDKTNSVIKLLKE